MKFKNENLNKDLEKIKGSEPLLGKSIVTDEGVTRYTVDVNDISYWYDTIIERNSDFDKLTKTLLHEQSTAV